MTALALLHAEDRLLLNSMVTQRSHGSPFTLRILACHAIGCGYPVRIVSHLFGTCPKTIYNWLHRYEQGGLQGLQDAPRPGRPHLFRLQTPQGHFTPLIQRMLQYFEWSDHTPANSWCNKTGKALQTWILHQPDGPSQCSLATVYRLLHHLGFSLQRPQSSPLGGNIHYQQAYARLLSITPFLFPQPTERVLFLDECSFNLHPTFTRQWARCGCQPQVPTTGYRARVSVIGAVDPAGDLAQLEATPRGTGTAASFLEFLRHLHEFYHHRGTDRLILCLDNCRIHRAHLVNETIREWTHPQIWLWFQPPYSPQLNPIEHLWRWIRMTYTHNKYFPTFQSLLDTLTQAFRVFTATGAGIISSWCNQYHFSPKPFG